MVMFNLKRIGAAIVILAVAWFGLQRVASAQTSLLITTQGVLSTAACDDASCMTLTATMTTPSGMQSFLVSRESTAVWVGTEKVSPTILDRFVGTPAIVLSAPMGSQQVAGRINILVFPVQGSVNSSVSKNENDRGSLGNGGSTGGGTTGGGSTGGGSTGGGSTGGGSTGGGTTGGGTTGG